MNEPKPLSNKTIGVKDTCECGVKSVYDAYYTEDIRSAVELLKQKIKEKEASGIGRCDGYKCIELIDECFPCLR